VRVLSATSLTVLEEPIQTMACGRGGGTYKSAVVEGMRGTAGDPAVFPRITGSVLRLVTG
jgi:hypothetical protein